MKLSKITIITACLLVALGCKKEDSTTVEAPTPNENIELPIENNSSAKPEDDNKSSGVYKGTFVGSSGSFKIVIQSDNISGILTVDGVGHNLSTTDITANDLGTEIVNAEFKNAAETISLLFSVEANGENPSATLTIDGHNNIQVDVVKESSSNQVRVYEGLLYYSYGDSNNAYQCAFFANIALKGTQGNTSVTYKYRSSNTIVGNANCDTDDFGTIDGYEYQILGSEISAFKYVYECDTCPAMVEYFLDIAETGSFSDEEIFFTSETWQSEGGVQLQDSVRFVRKL